MSSTNGEPFLEFVSAPALIAFDSRKLCHSCGYLTWRMRPRCAALALAAASLGAAYAAAECGELGRAHGLRLDFLNSEAADDINNLGRGLPVLPPAILPARAGRLAQATQ